MSKKLSFVVLFFISFCFGLFSPKQAVAKESKFVEKTFIKTVIYEGLQYEMHAEGIYREFDFSLDNPEKVSFDELKNAVKVWLKDANTGEKYMAESIEYAKPESFEEKFFMTNFKQRKMRVSLLCEFSRLADELEVNLIINILDREKPTINQIKPIVFTDLKKDRISDKQIEEILKQHFVFKDNISTKLTTKLLGTEDVLLNKPGKYQIEVHCLDENENKTVLKTYIEVKDIEAPKIEFKKPTELLTTVIGAPFFALNQFNITDNSGDELDIKVEGENKLNKVGVHELSVTATDKSGNSTTKKFMVEVKDTGVAEITFPFKELTKEVLSPSLDNEKIKTEYTNFIEEILKSAVVKDKVYNHLLSELNLDISEVNLSKVGKYKVTLNVFKPNTQEVRGSMSFVLEIKDTTKPTIDPIQTKQDKNKQDYVPVQVNSKFNLTDLFDIKDNYDFKSELKTTIDKTVDTKELGKSYLVEISVQDKAGNKISKSYLLKVVDLLPPTLVKQPRSIFLNVGEKFQTSKYFSYLDDTKVTEKLYVDGEEYTFNFNKPGKYRCELKLIDEYGNETIHSFVCVVGDNIPPVLELKTNSLTVKLRETNLFEILRQNISGIFDNVDKSINPSKCHIDVSGVNLEKCDYYKVYYTVKDSSENAVTKELRLLVDDKTKPTIKETSPLEIDIVTLKNIPSQIDYLKGLEITDNSDTKNNSKLDIWHETIDTAKNKELPRTLLYTATDERGNVQTYERTIIYKNSSKLASLPTAVKIAITVGISLILIGSVFGYFYLKDLKSHKLKIRKSEQ